jgi:hypothetical protein
VLSTPVVAKLKFVHDCIQDFDQQAVTRNTSQEQYSALTEHA